MESGTVVDSDSHILEPASMWRDYIDPAYRSRAMGIELDELGLEYLDIDGKMSSGYNGGALGRIAGVDKGPGLDDGARHPPLRGGRNHRSRRRLPR